MARGQYRRSQASNDSQSRSDQEVLAAFGVPLSPADEEMSCH